MMHHAVATPEDRTMVVPRGHVVKTAYVPVHRIRMACRERMDASAVERAYRRQLSLGDAQAWPCPVGWWEGDTFCLQDGRHAYVAALMLGFDHLLVAWLQR